MRKIKTIRDNTTGLPLEAVVAVVAAAAAGDGMSPTVSFMNEVKCDVLTKVWMSERTALAPPTVTTPT